MARTVRQIQSILGGVSPSYYFGGADVILSSCGIDPDFPVSSSVKTSGVIVPLAYTKFSGSTVTGFPKWIITNPKNTNTYIYGSDGGVHVANSSFAMQADLTTPTSGAGNGSAYYNNYLYFATPTNVSRYGPLDNSPSMTQTVWTGATLGSQTVLVNTTYPSIRGTTIPNHPMHVHSDGALYFGDVVAGQGVIHKIITKKVTDQGDTNNGSLYNALDLPFGFMPTDIESYGNDLVISAIQTTDASINQGKAALFFWNTIDDSFYNQVPLPDPLCTALLNDNGVLKIWSGNASNGCRVSYYVGGQSVKDLYYLNEGSPPFAGAVDALGNRTVWGGFTTDPVSSASVFAFGSKDVRLPMGLHNIIKSTSAGATQNVTSLKYIQQASNVAPILIVGWGDGSAKGLDKYDSAGTISSVIRTRPEVIGGKFTLKKVQIPLGVAVAANMSCTVKVYIDGGLGSPTTIATINNTNYAASDRLILATTEVIGNTDFFLEFTFGGTVAMPVLLPITYEIETDSTFVVA